jgi:membrane protease YdiL (CAAX protease family)
MNNLKGLLAGSPVFTQLFVLLSAVLGGFVLAGIFPLLFGYQGEGVSADMLRLSQLFSEVFVFLLPAILLAWLCSHHPSSYLSLKIIKESRVWGLTFISMFLLSPFITLTGFLNNQMRLPSFMAPVEHWMQWLETSAQKMTELLLVDSSGLTLLFNLVVIGVSAAVGEEIFFRGALWRILGRKLPNPHALIWIVAGIFSLIHFQFYGFIPRMLLGAYFGYLVYWSKSIWLPVFAHFINNGVAVVGMSMPEWKDNSYVSGEIPKGELQPFVLFSFIGLALFVLCVNCLYRQLRKPA